jgi:outer membrane protein TolC
MLVPSVPVRGLSKPRRVWIPLLACLAFAAGAPRAWAQDAGPTNLESCLAIAAGQQPALAAARASLAAAEDGKRGLDSIRFGAILSPDLPIRKQQACLGITIAAAGLQQAEWETRYAVARTYWSVLYARAQLRVVDSVIDKLKVAHEKAVAFVKAGDPNIKVTQIDVETLALNLQFARAKRAEAEVGVLKAVAGLREAMGVGLEYPLNIADESLPALVDSFDKNSLISAGLAQRGEMAQASAAAEVAGLEVDAQRRQLFKLQTKTFAAGADIHAKQIPQGVANGEYRPGAIGLEMPPFFAGHRHQRVDRAADLSARADAVVNKTTNLITLEIEAAYLKWFEAATKVKNLDGAAKSAASTAAKVQGRFDQGATTGEELMRVRTMEDYANSQYNEALFNHAVALATIERATAGGYRIPTSVAVPAPAPR